MSPFRAAAFSLLILCVAAPAPEQSRTSAVTSSISHRATIVAAADVKVETAVGRLPRLPLVVPAKYKDGNDGPDVRVIWPAPTDNAQVLEAGTYTIVGRIPGTDLQPKAVVHVYPASERATTAPTRSLEAFPLSDVTLNKDERGRDTPFIKNRDKFFTGLAATNADSFLYMFRDAFGQEQPEGARPLGGWDSQATRLRGHASGHYLSAIAQACAGCAHDEQLRADFKRKMDYVVDTLHDLSRKSGRPKEAGGEFNADPAAVPPGPGRDGYTSDLSEDAIRTDYWNWGEGFISAYCHLFDLQAWMFRFGNVVGFGMGHGVIYDFIHKLEKNPKELEILGDGRQEKNYFVVEDCIDGMFCAFRNSNSQCDVFNLGSESTVRVSTIAQIVVEEMGLKNVKFRYTGGKRGWPGDVPVVRFDLTKMKQLGWEAKHSSEEAVRIAASRLLGKERGKTC